MNRIIIFSLLVLITSLALAQSNNRIWLNISGHRDFDVLNNSSHAIFSFDHRTARFSSRLDFEKNVFSKNDKISLAISATISKNRLRYIQNRGPGGFNTFNFNFYGGGINIRRQIYKYDKIQFWVSNTTNWIHVRDSFRSKTPYKNFIENTISFENTYDLSSKAILALRISYNHRWDTRYPEPYRSRIYINPLYISLGFQF